MQARAATLHNSSHPAPGAGAGLRVSPVVPLGGAAVHQPQQQALQTAALEAAAVSAAAAATAGACGADAIADAIARLQCKRQVFCVKSFWQWHANGSALL
jgi:hypothetical protein